MNKLTKILLSILLIGLIILIIYNIYPFLLTIVIFIKNIILPFFFGFLLAYILEPVVRFLEKFLKKRKYAVFITFITLVIIIYLAIKFTFPFIQNELLSLTERLPEIIESLEEKINKFAENFAFLPIEYQPNFDNISNIIVNLFTKIDAEKVFNKTLVNIGNIIIIPVVLLYASLDFPKFIEKGKKYLEKKEKYHFIEYVSKLNEFFSKYIKTTLFVMFLMIMASTIIFTVIGLEYPLFFGTIIGLTNIIPYIGPYIGGAFPVIFALSSSSTKMIAVLISIVILQFVESNIISPYLHSKRSETHPLLVIFSLSLFGSLFGIIGMIFAVPILKFIEITFTYYPIKNIIKSKK